jgi:pimeloyl-ACP methyl ester carboxylesterase
MASPRSRRWSARDIISLEVGRQRPIDERALPDGHRLRGKLTAPVPRPWRLAVRLVLVVGIIGLSVEVGRRTRAEAHRLLTNPMATRRLPTQRPIDFGMVYEELTARTSDGLSLAGWFVRPANGSLILLQHGYKADRGEMLNEAAMLHRHGYGVLIMSLRAHDLSDGELITFGKHEIQDLDTWYRLAATLDGVDPGRVGLLGNSLGASLAIEFAARQPGIRAVVANSAFSSLTDTVETSLRFFTGLPPFPFAPLITFWAEREAGFQREDVDATRWIGRISPRPVLLMQGGKDVVISVESGERLYRAARAPRELWFEPDVSHAKFDTALPEEYERRVVALFDKYVRNP